jgi:arylsulfatase A-like enzyme
MASNRRNFLKTAGLAAAAAAAPRCLGALKYAGPAPRPNIVLIVADDLGYGDLGCYGQKKILTPNIDRLAAEGVRFSRAYAGSPVCAPSRCSLMTGMHNGHNRIRDNLPHGVFLRPDDVTVAEVLKQAGYRTGAIGKWSLGEAGSHGVPNKQGFDYWYGHLSQDQAIQYYPTYLWENEKMVLLQDMVMVNDVGKMVGNKAGKRVKYTHDLFTEKALSFIDDNADRPFFLYLPYTIPHFSEYPSDDPDHFMVPDDEPYTDRPWPQAAKNYAAMIGRLDRDVGRIIDRLKKLGIDSNTIVFFTSDNGPYLGCPQTRDFFDSNGPLRGGKRDLYEGGIRVPMIVRWPGKIRPGVVTGQLLAFWDFLPTAAELARVPAPEGIDGINVLPLILGGAIPAKHEYLYWDYGHVRKKYKQAVRMGQWKAVRNGRDAPIELYDLERDIGETADVAKECPELVKHMEQIMATAPSIPKDYR